MNQLVYCRPFNPLRHRGSTGPPPTTILQPQRIGPVSLLRGASRFPGPIAPISSSSVVTTSDTTLATTAGVLPQATLVAVALDRTSTFSRPAPPCLRSPLATLRRPMGTVVGTSFSTGYVAGVALAYLATQSQAGQTTDYTVPTNFRNWLLPTTGPTGAPSLRALHCGSLERGVQALPICWCAL